MAHETQIDIPDTVLPTQYFSKSRVDSPEKRLLFAVLEDAITIAANPVVLVPIPEQPVGGVTHRWSDDKYKAKTRNDHRTALYEETTAWFASDETHDIYCFVSICDVFGLDPSAIREGLKKITRPLANVRWRMSGSLSRVGFGTQYSPRRPDLRKRRHRKKYD